MNGLHRFKVATWHPEGPHLTASVDYAPETVESGIELEALQRQLVNTVKAVMSMTPEASKEAIDSIDQIRNPLQLAYVTALNINLPVENRTIHS